MPHPSHPPWLDRPNNMTLRLNEVTLEEYGRNRPWPTLERLWEEIRDLSQDSRCPGQDSNRAPPKCKADAWWQKRTCLGLRIPEDPGSIPPSSTVQPSWFKCQVVSLGQVEGSCEHGNEHSGSIKCWWSPEWLHNWRLLKNGSSRWG
jgi:hypothetical protein